MDNLREESDYTKQLEQPNSWKHFLLDSEQNI